MGRTGAGHATVSVNSVGALDVLQTALTELLPREKYTLLLMDSRTAPFGTKQALVTFQANASRAQIARGVVAFSRTGGRPAPAPYPARNEMKKIIPATRVCAKRIGQKARS
jgi:hypothetical protein